LKFHDYKEFLAEAAAGTLPSFSWIDPNYSDTPERPATDQHPDHDVGLGDQLMKEVYEAIRNGPLWNSTLLLITYDEHGGFFDHVPTPQTGVPNPDGKNSHDSNPSFDFTRLGIRVPAVAISPWIQKGVLVGEPGNSSHYEHSTVSATILQLLTPDQPFLTRRDAWAPSMGWLVDALDKPRTDCPTTLPLAPTLGRQNGILPPLSIAGRRPANLLQRNFVKMASALNNNGVAAETGDGWSEQRASFYVREHVGEYLKDMRMNNNQ